MKHDVDSPITQRVLPWFLAVGMATLSMSISIKLTDTEKALALSEAMLSTAVENAQQISYENNSARELLSIIFQQDMTSYTMASTHVTVTAYSARSAETDSSPELTADMTPSRIGLLAVSRDLLDAGLSYGQIVVLDGYGVFRISDTMNKRFTSRVDILHSSAKSAKLFGKQSSSLRWVF